MLIVTNAVDGRYRPKGDAIFESPAHATNTEAGDFADCAKTRQSIDREFSELVRQTLPELGAFGRSLSGSQDLAEDLVQETLLKAWAARHRFQPGTNFRAWTFMILRNVFLSQMRRSKFAGPWDAATADRILQAPAPQDKYLELDDVCQALLQLPAQQRQAVLFVGAGGYSYDETAKACNCAVGTVKSRVARGRSMLGRILDRERTQPWPVGGRRERHNATDQIFRELDAIACQ